MEDSLEECADEVLRTSLVSTVQSCVDDCIMTAVEYGS